MCKLAHTNSVSDLRKVSRTSERGEFVDAVTAIGFMCSVLNERANQKQKIRLKMKITTATGTETEKAERKEKSHRMT